MIFIISCSVCTDWKSNLPSVWLGRGPLLFVQCLLCFGTKAPAKKWPPSLSSCRARREHKNNTLGEDGGEEQQQESDSDLNDFPVELSQGKTIMKSYIIELVDGNTDCQRLPHWLR